MRHENRNRDIFGSSEQQAVDPVPEGLTLTEEAESLIQLIFQEFEETIINYPHHVAYCLSSIIHLSETTGGLSHFAQRLGMWLWIEVLAFQVEEPVSLLKLAEHFDTEPETIQSGIEELAAAKEFKIEWQTEMDIKLVPRMSKGTVLHFAEQALGAIAAVEQEEGASPKC